MRKIIHQIYWDFSNQGRKWKDINHFKIPMEKTKSFCKESGITYKLWNLKMITELINRYFSDYKDLWEYFRYPIQQCDFIRYCILYKYGGIYIDCDVYPLKNIEMLFEKEYFFVKRREGGIPYNAIMGCKPNQDIYKMIMEHSKKSTYEKQKQPIYDTWIGRLVFQTTGERMLHRILKKDSNILNILCIRKKDDDICGKNALFIDFNKGEITPSVWYLDMKSKKSKKRR